MLARERTLPREELVQHDAERPYVGALIDLGSAARLLGRHVERRAKRGPCARGHAAVELSELRNAEVEHLDPVGPIARASNEQVLGFQVPMNDAGSMRDRETATRLPRDV